MYQQTQRVTKEHNTLHTAEMWALTVSFVTLWMGLFFFQEAVRQNVNLLITLTVILLMMNTIYVLTNDAIKSGEAPVTVVSVINRK